MAHEHHHEHAHVCEHGHGHHHNHVHTADAKSTAYIAYAAASLLGIIAIAVQWYGVDRSHSNGLAADSFHVAADLWFNATCAYTLWRFSAARHPKRGPGLMLCATGLGSIVLGVYKYQTFVVADAEAMFWSSGAGLVLNVAMYVILERFAGGTHGHAHGHEHHTANLTHLAADTVSSFAIVLVAVALLVLPQVTWLNMFDPLLAVGIGVYLLREGFKKITS